MSSNPFGEDDGDNDGVSIWKIAAGVCLGSLAATAITWTAAELRVRWELGQVVESARSHAAQAQRQIQEAQRNSSAVATRAETQRADAEERRRRELSRQQFDASEEVRLRQEEGARRDATWKRFYKPSPECRESTATVECANEHIRAKREFEAKYANGQL